jgi:hypothetical protein
MKFKKRYKEGLKSFIKEIPLEMGKLLQGCIVYGVVSYLKDGDRKYLGTIIENKHYYFGEPGWKVCIYMLMESGLKARIDKIEKL